MGREKEIDLGVTEGEVIDLLNHLTEAVNEYSRKKGGGIRNLVVALALGALAGTMNRELKETFREAGIEPHGLDTTEPFLMAGMKFGETGIHKETLQ